MIIIIIKSLYYFLSCLTYTNTIFKKVLADTDVEYEDDTVILDDSITGLQRLLDKINTAKEKLDNEVKYSKLNKDERCGKAVPHDKEQRDALAFAKIVKV